MLLKYKKETARGALNLLDDPHALYLFPLGIFLLGLDCLFLLRSFCHINTD
jgi:hypothetical protein